MKDGQYQPLSEAEWQTFKQNNPELAKYFEDPPAEILEQLQVPNVSDQAPIYDSWEKAAKRMVN